MEQVPYLPVGVSALREDYSGRLIACGVILLLLAVCSGCATVFIPFSLVIAGRTSAAMQAQMQAQIQAAGTTATTMPGVNTVQVANTLKRAAPAFTPLMIVHATLIYVLFTAGLGWLAFGGLLKRRWFRPLLIVLGTHALIAGVLTFVAFLAFLPMTFDQIRAIQNAQGRASGAPQWAFYIGMSISGAFMFLFAVVLPALLLWLMRGDGVRLTAEHYDLRPRWTDGLPIKVVGLVVTLAVVGGFEVISLFRPRVPAGLTMLTGWGGAIFLLADAAAIFLALRLVLRREDRGWKLGFWAMLVPMALGLLTAALLPVKDYADSALMQPEAQEWLARHEAAFRLGWLAVLIGFIVAFVWWMRGVRPLVSTPVGDVPRAVLAASEMRSV